MLDAQVEGDDLIFLFGFQLLVGDDIGYALTPGVWFGGGDVFDDVAVEQAGVLLELGGEFF